MAEPSLTRDEVERYLHEHIPLTAAMGMEVLAAGAAAVVLRAPLAPNINHRETGFGGSISALAITAGWTWLHVALREWLDEPARIVIQRNEVAYLAPARGAMTARCGGPGAAESQRFRQTLERHGRARLSLAVRLDCDGEEIATFGGTYVALLPASA